MQTYARKFIKKELDGLWFPANLTVLFRKTIAENGLRKAAYAVSLRNFYCENMLLL